MAAGWSRRELLGWLARSHRVLAPDSDSRTLDYLTRPGPGGNRPLSTGMASMLERGLRPFQPHHVLVYEEALSLSPATMRAAFQECSSSRWRIGFLTPQHRADLLDGVTGGDDVDPVELAETIAWATSRTDPLGRDSWARLVTYTIDLACDTKGRWELPHDIGTTNAERTSTRRRDVLGLCGGTRPEPRTPQELRADSRACVATITSRSPKA